LIFFILGISLVISIIAAIANDQVNKKKSAASVCQQVAA
jgi:hypothetical protein